MRVDLQGFTICFDGSSLIVLLLSAIAQIEPGDVIIRFYCEGLCVVLDGILIAALTLVEAPHVHISGDITGLRLYRMGKQGCGILPVAKLDRAHECQGGDDDGSNHTAWHGG